MLELYHHGNSVCAQKVRLVLEEKGLDWRGHVVDILAGEQFRPEYMALNPRAVVPTLVHDGHVIRESTIICEYLDEVFPTPALKPTGAVGRAQMRLWTKLPDESLHAACAAVTFATYFRYTMLEMEPAQALRMSRSELEERARQTVNPGVQARKMRWLVEGIAAADVKDAFRAFDRTLDDMERRLGAAPWLAGADYSLADVGLTPYVSRLENLAFGGMWSGRRPRVTEWYARIKARPNFGSAIDRWIPAIEMERMKTFGGASWRAVEEMLEGA